MYLLDVNVWLALTFEVHAHHVAARRWFENRGSSERCGFCRHTQQGYLRIATNLSAFGKEAVTMDSAWKLYDKLLEDESIVFASEPENLEKTWRKYAQSKTHSPNVWSDAYLAAFATQYGWSMATFDRGFLQYKGLRTKLLA